MSVLDRTSLEASPLADLHAIASELSIDGYRRLRRSDLISVIIKKQAGGEADAPATAGADAVTPDLADLAAVADRPGGPDRPDGPDVPDDLDTPVAKGPEATTDGPDTTAPSDQRDTSRSRSRSSAQSRPDTASPEMETEAEPSGPDGADEDEERSSPRRRRGRRGGRGRAAVRADDGAHGDVPGTDAPDTGNSPVADVADVADVANVADGDDDDEAGAERHEPEPVAADDELVEGVVELLGNGSGFVRVEPPDPADEDVYISSAQVKRCELVSGDRVTGPKRAPRRSERFASLIRIETINGRPASELADGVRFDDLPAAYPDQRLKFGSEDPTLKAIEGLTPLGKGSRVTIVGPPRSGKTEALQRLAAAIAGHEDLALTVVLAGVRPEEIPAWSQGPVAPVAAVSFAAPEEAQSGAIESVVDQARRLAARGADAVVLIDTLDGCSSQVARKALASARNIVDGGSLTVIATAGQAIGGETTVIALDRALAGAGRFPALDMLASGTVRPELLVGQAEAEAIARARAEASATEAE